MLVKRHLVWKWANYTQYMNATHSLPHITTRRLSRIYMQNALLKEGVLGPAWTCSSRLARLLTANMKCKVSHQWNRFSRRTSQLLLQVDYIRFLQMDWTAICLYWYIHCASLFCPQCFCHNIQTLKSSLYILALYSKKKALQRWGRAWRFWGSRRGRGATIETLCPMKLNYAMVSYERRWPRLLQKD